MMKICFLKLRVRDFGWYRNAVHGSTKLFMAELSSDRLHEKVTRSRLDIWFFKKMPLEMAIDQQMKEDGHDQNY